MRPFRETRVARRRRASVKLRRRATRVSLGAHPRPSPEKLPSRARLPAPAKRTSLVTRGGHPRPSPENPPAHARLPAQGKRTSLVTRGAHPRPSPENPPARAPLPSQGKRPSRVTRVESVQQSRVSARRSFRLASPFFSLKTRAHCCLCIAAGAPLRSDPYPAV